MSLNSEIILNLGGNLIAKARQYSGAMQKFSESNSRMARGFRGSVTLMNRGFDSLENRYTALVATVAGGAAVNRLMVMDRRLSRLAVAADISREQANKLYQEIEDISRADGIRVDPTETLEGFEVIMEKIGEIKFAKDNLGNIAIVTQATGARGGDVGAVLTQLKKLSVETQQEVMAAMDILNMQGKSGAFTLRDFAARGELLLTPYATTGRTGIEAVRELGAAMQVIRQGVGSSEQAVTAYENLLTELTDPKRVAALKSYAGIDVFDPDKLKEGVEVLRPLPVLMQEITEAVDGKSKRWSILNFGDEAKRAFKSLDAELKETGEIHAFDAFMKVTGDGSVTMADAAKVAEDYTASMQTLLTAVSRLTSTELAKPMQELTDAINSLDSATIDRWLEVGKNIAYVTAGLIAARKALSIAHDLKAVFGKKNTGKPGQGSPFEDILGSGVMPVFVTNMGQGGLGSEPVQPGGGGQKPGTKPSQPTSAPKPQSRFTQAGKGLLGVGSALLQVEMADLVAGGLYSGIVGDTVRESPVRKWFDEQDLENSIPKAPSLGDIWGDITNLFSSERSTSEIQGNINVSVSDDRVRVKASTSTYPAVIFSVDNGLTMAD